MSTTRTSEDTGAFIGIDWGTTHRRATLLDSQGRVLATQSDGDGMLACQGRFRQSLEALLSHWGEGARRLPVVMSGMVGALNGWQAVPYVDQNTSLLELGRYLVRAHDAPQDANWYIVPGLCWRGKAEQVDVMRGEETQLLGALQLLGTAAAEGWYVLPGTHSKWVQLRQGRVAALKTYMTGELFALLRAHGTLAGVMQPAAGQPEAGAFMADDAAFIHGIAEQMNGALSHALFGARARVVTGAMAAKDATAYVSGLLLGAEWRDHVSECTRHLPIRIIGASRLASLHARCAHQYGCVVELLDAEAIQHAAWQILQRERFCQ